MKTAQNFREAFPQMDESFRSAVTSALADTEDPRQVLPRKLRAGAVLAAVMVLLAAAGAAAVIGRWGMMDFLQGISRREANEMIQTPVLQQVENLHAVFTIEEVIYDGRSAYMTVSVKGKDGLLVLPGLSSPESPLRDVKADAEEGVTIARFAAALGYTDYAYLQIDGQVWNGQDVVLMGQMHTYMEDDGTLKLMMATFALDSITDTGEVDVTFGTTVRTAYKEYIGWQEQESYSLARVDMQVTRTAAEERYAASAEPVVYDTFCVRIDEIRLTATPLAVYYDIIYTDLNENAKTSTPPVLLRFMNQDGTAGPVTGTPNATVMRCIDRTNRVWKQSGTLPAVEELPETMDLRMYQRGDMNVRETKTIRIKTEK